MQGDFSLKGKTVVITGATSGIGLAAAERLVAMGANLAIAGRDVARGEAAVARLREIAPEGQFRLYIADLSRLSEMKRLAAELLRGEPRIDVLINNAGAYFPTRQVTEDGLEATFALNHVAPFVVTNLLRPKLMETAPSRVITTASIAHQSGKLDFDDLMRTQLPYHAFQAYRDSKLGNILFTEELARRLSGTGVTANSFHPGLVASRFGGEQWWIRLGLRFFGISTARGAETAVHLAAAPELAETSGQYFVKCRAVKPRPPAGDPETARRLWEETARLAKLEAFLAV